MNQDNNNSNKNNKGILIAIIIVVVIAIIGIILFFALKPNNKNIPDDNNNQQNNEIEENNNQETKNYEIELYGYKFIFPTSVEVAGSSDGCRFFSNGISSIFAYKLNDIDFSSWDETTVIKSSEHSLFGAIYSAFRFYPEEQSITISKKITNKNNIDMLKIEGTFAVENSKKDFIIYYYLTRENKVRFIIGIVDDNRNELIKTIDYVADNLKIAD